MRVGVGSGNPVKRRAVESVLGEATVEAVPVESGVSEQPFGHAETVAGAENRARRVLGAGAYDYGVGVEGGVAAFPREPAADRPASDAAAGLGSAVGFDAPDGLFLVMWAAVTDGERVGLGAGPSLELPAPIADRVREGEELGPVMDDALGTTDVAKKRGAAGALTGGRIDRESALAAAVAGAFGPFATDLYD
ncbi:inosine/xanthosine triphosphatase [Halegenticoccus tardaugens]|uniref:inosine/xanthosine triphosphatase n=1 Tax=Halegenticoccus tardaugens TaxID=2071624 RepID=UPI00100B79C8|nr:inosine/xanthosine triphosphatase [Halegenticoccus tardaugens]